MKHHFYNSLRTRLFLWFVGSLFVLVVYFLLFIHFYTIKYGMEILIFLFIVLATAGFVIIHRITKSLSYLSSRMQLISSKNLEERILDLKGRDEIGILAQTFNNLLDRLNSAFKRERQFITDVAHELKTPMATLQSSFEIVLSRERRKEEYKKLIKEAIEETSEISSLLKNILDLAWMETPHDPQKMRKFDLTELMDDLFEITQKMALQKKINVEKLFERDVYIRGFQDKLGRALLNIIDNAVKYTSYGGRILLRLEKNPRRAIVTIEDTGHGISTEDLPHIFDRFYRGAVNEKVFGAGLGLSICQSIVNLHKGEIHIKSKLGKGSVFVIVLPLAS